MEIYSFISYSPKHIPHMNEVGTFNVGESIRGRAFEDPMIQLGGETCEVMDVKTAV